MFKFRNNTPNKQGTIRNGIIILIASAFSCTDVEASKCLFDWEHPGAESYTIYRNNHVLAENLTEKKYLTDCTEGIYAVRAFSEIGLKSDLSNKIKLTGKPKKPVLHWKLIE